MRLIKIAILGLVAGSATIAQAYNNLEVTVQTTSCEGDVGFSSFYSGDLHKIQAGWCYDPNDSGKKLQQVMIRSKTLPNSYDLLWVTQDEARNIMAQIREGRNAKLKAMEQPTYGIYDEYSDAEEVIETPQQRPRAQPAVIETEDEGYEEEVEAPTETIAEEDSNFEDTEYEPPLIRIIDPFIASTRSSAKILTPAHLTERAIVGKIEAPAGLISVTVNGISAEFDENGVFIAQVPLEENQTSVRVVAVDKKGQNQNLQFELRKAKKDADTASAADSDFGNYYALVIANTKYSHMDRLTTPANDADVISDILENKYGFDVTTVRDANRYDMMTALNEMRSTLTEQDNLLIYYAGHGAFDKTNNRGHWLPTDAEPNSTANWVSTIAITDIVNSMSAKHVLLVADSCYSGAITRNTAINLDAGMSEDARNKWLRTMAKTRSRNVLTSGDVKPVLDDGGNGHSVFASAFIDVLEQGTGIVESSQIFEEVKRKVENRAKELQVEQTPMYAPLQDGEHEFGEFLLVTQEQ